MTTIAAARAKAETGERLSLADAMTLYQENDLLFLAACARRMKEKKSGRKVFYTVNRHINLTNICRSHCPLCAFQVGQDDPRGFVCYQHVLPARVDVGPDGVATGLGHLAVGVYADNDEVGGNADAARGAKDFHPRAWNDHLL